MDIPRHNLNLLVVLDALLNERSITRAAARLHLSQPATSAAVGKLRDWLGDPLLVRGTNGYTLTARGEDLIGPVRLILENIERTIQIPCEFNPADAVRTFRIAANDAFELVVLPGLIERLHQLAPHVRLMIVSTEGTLPVNALASGEVDFAWGNFDALPAGFYTQVMFEDSLACLVRNGHPLIKNRLTLAQYGAASHIVVALKGNILSELVQRRLVEVGVSLNVGLQVPHMLAAPFLAAKSDYLVTLPRRVARSYAELLDLKLFKLPFAFPSYEVSLVWHERALRDPASLWLRNLLKEVCKMN
mgnify:CR=1 FL=1